MKIKTKITIGIPAFNEEANIGYLLRDLLKQNQNNFIIEKILVVSDGSTDQTDDKVKELKNKKIYLTNHPQRQGLARTQNVILEKTNSDILVLLNADIRIYDRKFIEKVIKPIVKCSMDLVTPSVTETEPETFFEKILYVSTKIKNTAYENYRSGDNVYTCRGVARAFSKSFYKKMIFSTSIGEDAFSYYVCKMNGFKYYFEKNAKVVFRLPNNYSDHQKQSARFYNSKELLKKEFGKRTIAEGYKLDLLILLKSLILNFIKSPLYVALYICVIVSIKIQALFIINCQDLWEVSLSSKRVGEIKN